MSTKYLSALFQVFQLVDWTTEGLKLLYGREAAGDLLWAVYLTFFLATFVLWVRFVHFLCLSGLIPWRRTVSWCCGCGFPGLTRVSERHSSEHATRIYEDKPITTLLLGLPVSGAMATAFACESIVENRAFEHTQNMLRLYQVVLEDVPNFVLDLAIIVQNSGEEDGGTVPFLGESWSSESLLWFNLSLAFSLLGLVFACGACVHGFMREEGSLFQARPARAAPQPAQRRCCPGLFQRPPRAPTAGAVPRVQSPVARGGVSPGGHPRAAALAPPPLVTLRPQASAPPIAAGWWGTAGAAPVVTLQPQASAPPIAAGWWGTAGAAHPMQPALGSHGPQVVQTLRVSSPVAGTSAARAIAPCRKV